MRVFLDFEASSLSDDSYPVEVGWVFEDGTEEAHLIRPAPAWTDWDPTAEAVHGLSRATLEAEGEPHEAVASRMLDRLAGHELYASSPSWDGKWMSVLLRAAGLPRHALRLRDSELAFVEAARAGLPQNLSEEPAQAAALIVAQALREREARPVAHRALADAQEERRTWLRAASLAAAWKP
ncbi:3'-5' exonuclease [Phenylobacterium sp.]|uniref:3'-5' exonuclease n=1 Tax=Phenylobacterium sp. TaxID=1871053 RepID=UPI002FE2A349